MLGIVFVLGLTAYRVVRQYHTGGDYTPEMAGMVDFHNGSYYPSQAFMAGVSPYGDAFASDYPVSRPSPANSPFIFLLHIPLALLPLPVADMVCFALITCLLGALTYLPLRETISPESLSWWPVLFLGVLLSRPAHTTLVSGYFTAELALGVLLALRYSTSRPTWSAVGVLLASGKPTFALPLGLVMLFRGNIRALTLGVAFSVLAAVLCGGWVIGHSSLSEFVETIRQGQAAHMADDFELPVTNWTRIDIVGILAKWTEQNPSELFQVVAMLPLMILPCVSLWKLHRNGDSTGITTLSGMIAILALLVTLYHHIYDALICIGPIIGLLFGNYLRLGKQSLALRVTLLVLIALPAVNYLSSQAFLMRYGQSAWVYGFLTSLNAVCLTSALILCCGIALRTQPSASSSPSSSPSPKP